MPREPTHRVALTQKTFATLIINKCRQHLDSDVSPQGGLATAIDHSDCAARDLARAIESGSSQLRDDVARSWRLGARPGSISHFLASTSQAETERIERSKT